MREIKFRIWDNESNSYIPNTGNPNIFPFNGKVGMTCNGSSTGHINTSDWIQEEYTLEQFTGLKDKNGKEIYEGDKVKTTYGFTGIVVWNELSASFLLDNTDTMGLHSIIGMEDDFEVIGNIHESD